MDSNVPYFSPFSFGTFSFWAAYLRPHGEVIVADGYSSKSTILLNYIKSILPEWKIFPDPCFLNSSRSDIIPRLTKECHDKKIEYGIFDD